MDSTKPYMVKIDREYDLNPPSVSASGVYLCRDDQLTFVVSVITLVGKREVSITFFYRKWTTTLIPAHYGSGRRIQDFSGGLGGGGGGGGGGDSGQARYDKWGAFSLVPRPNGRSCGWISTFDHRYSTQGLETDVVSTN